MKTNVATDLAPQGVSLKKEPQGSLILTLTDGTSTSTYEDVRARLAFPLSQSDRTVSFQLQDGTDLGTLKDLHGLDRVSADALKAFLDIAYFIPRITAVREIREEYGVTRWSVETDRGRRTFEVQSRQDVRQAGPTRYIIRDIDGNRYEIRNVTELDAESASWLDLEL